MTTYKLTGIGLLFWRRSSTHLEGLVHPFGGFKFMRELFSLLTEKQGKVGWYTKKGLTAKEIGELLGISGIAVLKVYQSHRFNNVPLSLKSMAVQCVFS